MKGLTIKGFAVVVISLFSIQTLSFSDLASQQQNTTVMPENNQTTNAQTTVDNKNNALVVAAGLPTAPATLTTTPPPREEVKDANGVVTSYVYKDPQGRVLKVEFLVPGTTKVSQVDEYKVVSYNSSVIVKSTKYDPASGKKTQEDIYLSGSATSTLYSKTYYNANEKISSIDYYLKADGTGSPTVTAKDNYKYDNSGNLMWIDSRNVDNKRYAIQFVDNSGMTFVRYAIDTATQLVTDIYNLVNGVIKTSISYLRDINKTQFFTWTGGTGGTMNSGCLTEQRDGVTDQRVEAGCEMKPVSGEVAPTGCETASCDMAGHALVTYDGTKVSKKTYTDRNGKAYSESYLNTDGTLNKIVVYTNGVLDRSEEYLYNAGKRIKKTVKNAQGQSVDEWTYDAAGRESGHVFYVNGTVEHSEAYFYYDSVNSKMARKELRNSAGQLTEKHSYSLSSGKETDFSKYVNGVLEHTETYFYHETIGTLIKKEIRNASGYFTEVDYYDPSYGRKTGADIYLNGVLDHREYYVYDSFTGKMTSKEIRNAIGQMKEKHYYNSSDKEVGFENYVNGVLEHSEYYVYDSFTGKMTSKEIRNAIGQMKEKHYYNSSDKEVGFENYVNGVLEHSEYYVYDSFTGKMTSKEIRNANGQMKEKHYYSATSGKEIGLESYTNGILQYSEAYNYNANGLLSDKRTYGPTGALQNTAWYSYNAANQLQFAYLTNGAGVTTDAFAYDPTNQALLTHDAYELIPGSSNLIRVKFTETYQNVRISVRTYTYPGPTATWSKIETIYDVVQPGGVVRTVTTAGPPQTFTKYNASGQIVP